MEDGADARRAGPPTTPRWPGRVRLGKREWRDVCRGARTLGDIGTLRAAEIHGVKIFFGWAVSHQKPMDTSGGERPMGPKADGGAAQSQRKEQRQSPAMNSRQRRSAQRLQEFLQLKQAQAQADTSLSASGGSGTPLSGSKREARSRTPEEARKQPRDSPAADDGGVAAAQGCVTGTQRQQALAGSPAGAALASLPSDDESSAEEAESSSDDAMPDSAAETAAQRGAQQGHREVARHVGPGGKGSGKGMGKGSGKGLGKGQGKSSGKGQGKGKGGARP